MTTICILGAAGRMGQTLLRTARCFSDLRVVSALERPGHAALGQDAGRVAGIDEMDLPIATSEETAADVVIDFTLHLATHDNVFRAAEAGQAFVLGTTGLDDRTEQTIAEAAKRIPIVRAPNMSMGVNVLLELVRRAAAILDASYDVEVVEMHHRLKKDAPSGTALGLADAVAAGRDILFDQHAVYGRHGITGERPKGEIGLHSLRGGDVVGDHTVIFATDGERIELTHKASNREAFARGALSAARWLAGRQPGLYTMRDVLGLN